MLGLPSPPHALRRSTAVHPKAALLKAARRLLRVGSTHTYNHVFRSGDSIWDWLGGTKVTSEGLLAAAAEAEAAAPAATVLDSLHLLGARLAEKAHKGDLSSEREWSPALRMLTAIVMFSPMAGGQLCDLANNFFMDVDDEWNNVVESDSEGEDEETGETNRQAYDAFEYGRMAWKNKYARLNGPAVMAVMTKHFSVPAAAVTAELVSLFEIDVDELLDEVGSFE